MSSLIRVHYDPFVGFERLFDDAFSTRVGAFPSRRNACTNATQPLASFRPRMDLKESEESNTVAATFELPGLKAGEVAIEVQEDRLTVSGESSSSSTQAEERDGYTVRERRYGKFSRTLQLPFGTKPEDVKAKLENGILTVTFPRTSAERAPQRIAIQ